MRFGTLGFCAVLAMLLLACSSESNKPEEPAKPEPKGPELITAAVADARKHANGNGYSAGYSTISTGEFVTGIRKALADAQARGGLPTREAADAR